MCGSPVDSSGGSSEARKNVSILFIDIVGSTALAERLDPEPLRQLLDRYFAACVSAIGEHGGAVEKFVGDAVLAVFGATITHEDDAVRAVRAAAECLASLHDLNADVAVSHGVTLEARCGVCSGEVVVITTPGGDFRVIGDAVNTASRLQNAAQPGEILIGEQTAAMVRGHAGLDRSPELRLKGKSSAVQAWRVTNAALDADEAAASPDAPLIGRDDELEELRRGMRRVTQRSQVCLVTVLGPPGIGKTRLVREFTAGLPDAAATVLWGRCSPYGKDITYAPLASMLRGLPGGWPGSKSLLLADPGPGTRAAHGLAAVLGEHTGQADQPEHAGVEEISWAVRHLLKTLARDRPVIMVWDGLQWAGQALLDLVDDAATWLHDVPVLLICPARTELLETRPAWGGGKPCAATLELGPLTYEQSAALVSELALHGEVYPHAVEEVCGRVAAECEGNPLFAELMLDFAAETAPGVQTPPTIHALLGARLDQLPPGERQVLDMAAAAGRDFSGDTLRALAGHEGATVNGDMAGLIRRRLIQRTGPDSYRFRQALLRDTAYALTPKARRERWHLFLAGWFRERAQQAGPQPETGDALVFAYHVETAYLLRRDLMPGSVSLPELSPAAAKVLIGEGERALKRKDLSSAATLLERGVALLPPGDYRRLPVVLHICDAWLGLWNSSGPTAILAVEEAAPEADRRTLATCAIQRCIVALRLGLAAPATVSAQMEHLTAELHDGAGGDLAWCRYHQLSAYLQLAGENTAAAAASLRLALARARAMADLYEEERILCAICEVSQWSQAPLREGLELCATLADRFAANRALLIPVLVTQARMMALTGRLADARHVLATARAHTSDLHLDLADAAVLAAAGTVESLAGAHGEAETYFRRAAAALRTAPRAPDAGPVEVAAVREMFQQGRAGAAAALDQVSRRDKAMDLRTRISATALRSRIASRAGRHEEAVTLAAQALDLCEAADDPYLTGEALFDLAIVTRAAGLTARSGEAAAWALERFTAKGALLPASQVRDWISAQQDDAARNEDHG